MTFKERDRTVLNKTDYDSHYYKIYIYLRDVGSLTTKECIDRWGRYNLAQVVAKLKKRGAIIIDRNVQTTKVGSRYRQKRLKPWARYELIQEDEYEQE